MGPDWIESDAVWDSIPGAFAVWCAYGVFPSFRDAAIGTVEVGMDAHSILVEFLCRDTPRHASEPVETRIRMRWNGVVHACVGFEDRQLYDMIFSRQDSLITTTMNQPSHVSTIVAESVEVVAVEVLDRPDVQFIREVVLR